MKVRTRLRVGMGLLIGGAVLLVVLMLLATARAADLPIPPLAIGVTPLPATRSILPPGMRSISVTLTRERPREESRRAFIRRLLSSRGKGRLE